MKFIESYELREWVKDSLRKAIFQKAHALAVQTGCEILVKLHDTQDISGCQYYATSNLKRIYRNSKLRQPGEMLVSGETGLPLMDKCIQYGEDASASTDSGIPGDLDGGGDGESNFQGADQGAVPMHLSSSGLEGTGTNNFNSQTQTQTQGDGNEDSDIEITQITNPQNLLGSNVQIKQEPMFEQQNTMFGQQGMMGNQGMMDNQGMMGSQSMISQAHQVPIAPKPYQCSICRKAFKSVHVLQKHTLTFHTPGGGGGALRTRGRGGRGSRSRGRGSRGRGRGLHVSRPNLAQPPQQFQAMPTVKTEAGGSGDPNSTLCMMCHQTFEQPEQLSAHITQCPMAQQAASQNPSEAFTDTSGGVPAAAGSMDQSGFPQQFQSASQEDPSSGSQSDPNWQFMPPDGSSPSGLNLPSASSFFGQQSPSTSMYSTQGQSPGQSPRPSTSGGSGSRAEKMRLLKSRGHLRQNGNLTKRNIMAGILQTTGPVSTHRVVRLNWKFLRMLSSKQFDMAGEELEKLGLGSLLTCQGGGKLSVFVKRLPSEVGMILEGNPDLCSLEHYAARFYEPTSKILSQKVKERLVADGIVGQHLFR